jgi:hypothetical protein
MTLAIGGIVVLGRADRAWVRQTSAMAAATWQPNRSLNHYRCARYLCISQSSDLACRIRSPSP